MIEEAHFDLPNNLHPEGGRSVSVYCRPYRLPGIISKGKRDVLITYRGRYKCCMRLISVKYKVLTVNFNNSVKSFSKSGYYS